jgi:glycosyltransferase involved in cell wall biosynthesis
LHPDPRVVVGVPVYNGENFLDEALTAVRNQTLTEIAVVISDNASTDGTAEIAKHHMAEDDRITVVQQPTNFGAAPNYNAAYLAAPPSEYFCWLAHDDLPMADYLASCVAALDADPGAVLAFGGTAHVEPDGRQISQAAPRPALGSPDPAVRLADVIDRHQPNHPVFGVIRRTALDRTGLHGSYTGSDRALVAELAMLGRFIGLPETLFAVREHPGRSVRAKTSTKWHTREAWFDASRAGHIVFPRWRRMRDYLRGVANAPLSSAERRRAYAAIGRWVLDGNWKALIFDVRLAGRSVSGRAVQKIRR